MDFKIINELLVDNTDSLRYKRGSDYYKDGYVEEVRYTNENGILSIDGYVASESSNRVYDSSIKIDLVNREIISAICNCEDCLKRSKAGHIAICKHIVSASLYVSSLLKSDVISSLKQKTVLVKNKNKIKRSKDFINKDLLDFFKNKEKEKVKLEIKVELIAEHTLCCDFKIGIDKMYVMKNLKEFAYARLASKDLIYGVDFLYNPLNNYFDSEYEDIVNMIEEYGMSLSYTSPQKDFRYMNVKNSNVRRLFESLQYKDFDFKFRNMYYNPKIIVGELPIKIDLEMDGQDLILRTKDVLPYPLSLKGDVVFYKGDIYLLSMESGIYYKKLYSLLKEFKEISFERDEVSQVLTDIVPKLSTICEKVQIDETIEENTSRDLQVKYYFDLEDSKITCDLKFYYEGEEKGKFIIKDTYKEKEAIYRLYTNYFEEDKDKYIFRGSDNQLYNFLSKEIDRLKNIGEVYYSDKLKERKIYTSSSFKIGLGEEVNHYLDFNFKIEGIDEKEYKNILNAFKVKKRFYKLGNGNFVNLEDSETIEIFKLMESLGFTDNINNMKIHSSKALYIDDLLTEKKLPFIDGMENTKEIINKFKNIDKLNIQVPNELKASLRDYQINSLNWFETLDFLGFGGILADEMGLGKTIQTIAFLLTKKNSNSLIITPTSLIYNWKNEFEKFAPSIKVGIVHGLKKERIDVIKNVEKYDVIITTYGSLRNDLDYYDKMNFDYCIIDEAQNIKNPLAASTDAVKAVKAKNRFALTGTPIENNLLELWSIFDFIMPGYLYNLTKFNAVFIKDETQIENLKKMIRPFILRRTKKQVIKELPDKIERQFLIEMGKSQKNVYGVYVEDVKQKLKEKKDIKNKITVFSYLTKLRQLCLDPSIVIEGYKGKSAKTEACLDIIKEYTEENNKILVFSQFTTVLKNIGKKLDKNNIKYYYLDGSTKSEDRIRLVEEFNKKTEIKVFLISLKAGGTGLNLTSANTVIHFDPWWNPSVENQASDRAHRYGQKQVVEVIKLIAKGTIEEKIVSLQESKKQMINDMIDGNLSDGGILKNLSDDEILDLFR